MIKWNTCIDCKHYVTCFNRKANNFRKLNPQYEDTPVTMKMIGMVVCPGFKEASMEEPKKKTVKLDNVEATIHLDREILDMIAAMQHEIKKLKSEISILQGQVLNLQGRR